METQKTPEEKQQKKARPPFKIKTKDIALAAVLTAISILFPLYLPTLDIGITSVTPFSHLGIFIAAFINPVVAVFTCVGTFLAFVFKGANPIVLTRAGSHIIFALVCSLLMWRKGKGYKGVSFYAVCGTVTLLHAAAEMLSAVAAIALGASGTLSVYQIFVVVGLITCAHSIFDYSFAVLIYNTLSQARLVENRFDLRVRKTVKTKAELVTTN